MMSDLVQNSIIQSGNIQAINPTRLALEEKIRLLEENINVAKGQIADIYKVLELFPHPFWSGQQGLVTGIQGAGECGGISGLQGPFGTTP
jgi:hypothetical protein